MIPHTSIANAIILNGYIDVSKEMDAFNKKRSYPLGDGWRLDFEVDGLVVRSEMKLCEWGLEIGGAAESLEVEVEITLFKDNNEMLLLPSEEDAVGSQIVNMIHYE